MSLVIDLVILFAVVLYGALVYWTYADARRRILDPMLIGCSTAASLFFPFVGTIVYMIVRPPEYLDDVHERELEVQAAEARLHELDHGLCPHCDYPIERDFIRCPSCLRRLKDRCVSCSRPLERSWTICPYCETEVPGAKPARSAPSRSRSTSAMTDTASLAHTSFADEPLEAELRPQPAAPQRSPAAARSAARAAERLGTEEEPPVKQGSPGRRTRSSS